MSLAKTIKVGNLGHVWIQTCSRSLIVFLSQLFVIFVIIFGCFGKFTFQKIVTNQMFGLDICAVRQDTFRPNQDYEQVNFYNKSSLYFIGCFLQKPKNRSLFTIG